MRPVPPLPTFAVVGQPNEGKTTVMATLAENDQALISPIPGTTVKAQRYPVCLDDQELLVFWDTPGFENSGEVLEWFKQHEGADHNLAGRFIAAFSMSGRFQPECEILRPLAEGAAVIYVVDASRPVRPVDRWEIDILRRCGNPRIGVINPKEGGPGEFLADWQHVMATDFNHRHEFNGHRATFRDRMDLLRAIRAVIPEWKRPMDQALRAMEEDWEGRLREVTGVIIDALKETVSRRARETVQTEGDEARAASEASIGLKDKIRRLERDARRHVRRIFRHSSDHWLVEELLEADLFSEKVWRLLGLTRKQLLVAGAMAGAVVGGMVDAHTAGGSFLIGTLVGGAGGAVLAWMSAEKAVHVRVPGLRIGPLRFAGGKLGGAQVEARVHPKSNLVWVLLDRLLLYVELASSWSHGRRDVEKTVVEGEQAKRGQTSGWTSEERSRVVDFLGHLCRKKPDSAKTEKAERALREMIKEKLRRLTTG